MHLKTKIKIMEHRLSIMSAIESGKKVERKLRGYADYWVLNEDKSVNFTTYRYRIGKGDKDD